jgi:hypothetical protein
MKRVLLICMAFLFINSAHATDTTLVKCKYKIMLLTCAPGTELYASFGHTALRITDSTVGMDIVLNYGTFDFSDPNFYSKFVQGKLDYYLSVESISNFLYLYQLEDRSVWQQELHLNCTEKEQIYLAVQQNLQGNNRFYRYDFLYDNCTSRVRDLLFKQKPILDSVHIIAPGTTHRQLIHEYLDKGGKSWEKLGIDILLGSLIDQPITQKQAMFLPEYLKKAVDSSKDLAVVTQTLHQSNITIAATKNHLPLLTLSIIAIVLALIGFQQKKSLFGKLADSLWLYLTGIIGILLVFMWFFTDHIVCQANYNLLWALPLNIFAAIGVWKKPRWFKRYALLGAIMSGLTLAFFFFLPQVFNNAIVPILLLTLVRFTALSR